MNRMSSETKIVLLSAILICAVVGALLAIFVPRSGKVGIKIVVLPPDSTLTIDGKRSHAGTIYLTKTTHTLTASRQYFNTVSQKINVATYNPSQTVYMNPSPDSDQAIQYLKDHPDVQAKREAAAGDIAGRAQDQLNKDEILKHLPYTGPGFEYEVDYGATGQPDGSQKVTLYIQANTDQAKQDALAWIKSQGSNPDKFTIVYQNLSSTAVPDAGGSGGGSEYQ